MFRQPPIGPQPSWKRPIYLTATVILWTWLGLFMQILFLIVVDRDEQLANFSLVSPWRLLWLAIFGLLGFFIGRIWWRWIYVEGRWVGQKGTTSRA